MENMSTEGNIYWMITPGPEITPRLKLSDGGKEI